MLKAGVGAGAAAIEAAGCVLQVVGVVVDGRLVDHVAEGVHG
jgi:hypothetical protein